MTREAILCVREAIFVNDLLSAGEALELIPAPLYDLVVWIVDAVAQMGAKRIFRAHERLQSPLLPATGAVEVCCNLRQTAPRVCREEAAVGAVERPFSVLAVGTNTEKVPAR